MVCCATRPEKLFVNVCELQLGSYMLLLELLLGLFDLTPFLNTDLSCRMVVISLNHLPIQQP